MRRAWAVTGCVLIVACSGNRGASEAGETGTTPGFEPPVVTNPESPVSYPEDLYEQQVDGTVVLRLFVDDRGTVVPESTRVAETSGYAGLDSAALRSVGDMHFAPARRNGQPVSTAFLQPVHFRHLDRARTSQQP